MWSDKYLYFNIYSDNNLSKDFDTCLVVDLLQSFPELERKSDFYFTNSTKFPFINISVLHVTSLDSWSGDDTNNEKSNLLDIVCAKDKQDEIIPLIIRIASFVGWQLVLEQSDEGIENEVVWKPEENTTA